MVICEGRIRGQSAGDLDLSEMGESVQWLGRDGGWKYRMGEQMLIF